MTRKIYFPVAQPYSDRELVLLISYLKGKKVKLSLCFNWAPRY
jgi:hypothetical protein